MTAKVLQKWLRGSIMVDVEGGRESERQLDFDFSAVNGALSFMRERANCKIKTTSL